MDFRLRSGLYLFYGETIEVTDLSGNHFRINIWRSAAPVISGDTKENHDENNMHMVGCFI